MHITFDVPEPTVDAAGMIAELHIDAVKPLRQRALCRLPFASRALGQVRGSNELLAQVVQLGSHVGDIAPTPPRAVAAPSHGPGGRD